MEVTKQNFAEVYPEIESAVKCADFLSIDGEFTGLYCGSGVNSFDTPAECYDFYRKSCKEFLLFQIGLAVFRFDPDTRSYKHRVYTFYLFPRQEFKGISDKVFSCQSSSLEFLSKHKFDFNKVFYEGISYIDTTEEVKLRERIEEKQKQEMEVKSRTSKGHKITVPDNHVSQIGQICAQVQEFLNDKKKDKVEFENLNSFQRKLAYQELNEKFDKKIHMETKDTDGKKFVLVVSRAKSEMEKKMMIEAAHEKEWKEFDSAIGFSSLARFISDSGKLLIGHNVILDLLHCIDSFFYPLPESYTAFKALVPHIFPNVIDTMNVVRSNNLKDFFPLYDLESIYKTLKKDPFVMPKIEAENEAFDMTKGTFHSAGFDAFITGSCLISLFEHMKKITMPPDSDVQLNENCELLKPFMNKLYLHRTSFQGLPYMNLSGNDPNPRREHVFHITFPKEWKRNEIGDVFEPYGIYEYFEIYFIDVIPIHQTEGGFSTVAFIDDTSAYVSLKQHGKAQAVKRDLVGKNDNYTIIPYWEFKGRTKASKTENPQTPDESFLNVSLENHENIVSSPTVGEKPIHPKRKLDDEDLGVQEKRSPDPKPDDEVAPLLVQRQKSPTKGKKRKLSHSSSGDFVVLEGGKNSNAKEKPVVTSEVFQESDSWE